MWTSRLSSNFDDDHRRRFGFCDVLSPRLSRPTHTPAFLGTPFLPHTLQAFRFPLPSGTKTCPSMLTRGTCIELNFLQGYPSGRVLHFLDFIHCSKVVPFLVGSYKSGKIGLACRQHIGNLKRSQQNIVLYLMFHPVLWQSIQLNWAHSFTRQQCRMKSVLLALSS